MCGPHCAGGGAPTIAPRAALSQGGAPTSCGTASVGGPPRADLAGTIAEVATGSYIPGMRAVGIKALKDRLSEYVRIAAGGETVLVTDRDQVVAELGPPRAGRAAAVGDALLAEAVRQGWVTPPSLVGQGEPTRLPVAPWATLAAGLDHDRADR